MEKTNDYWMDYLNDDAKAKIKEALLDRVCEELENEEGFSDKNIKKARKSKAVEQYIKSLEDNIVDGAESYIRDSVLESIFTESSDFRDMVDNFHLEMSEKKNTRK